MDLTYFKKKKLPDAPGGYIFKAGKGKTKKIIYIGKATSLRDRVRSYFGADLIATRGPLLVDMVTRATALDFIQTDSVLEAIVLEAYLIKKHQPQANTKEKSNKSFNYVVITDEEFPAITIVRGRELELDLHNNVKYSFGPFPNGTVLREAMSIIRKIFPYRDLKCTPHQGRPCFNYQIGLCPGPCVDAVTRRDYARTINHIRFFFEGKKALLVKKLRTEMNQFARAQEFEKAEENKRTIFALEHIKDVALMKRESDFVGNSGVNESIEGASAKSFRIESYDIAHISGSSMVGGMVVMEDGEFKRADYRKFKIRSVQRSNDTAALREILTRRLNHPEWPMPDLISIDGGEAQRNVAVEIIKNAHLNIPVISVVKDDRHKAREILDDGDATIRALWKPRERDILMLNAEAHRYTISFHRNLRGRNMFK